jgi:uncharacterized protein YkwD
MGLVFVFVYFLFNALLHPQILNPIKPHLNEPIEPFVFNFVEKLPKEAPINRATVSPTPKIPWGTTEKISDHTYRTYVGQDLKMGTPKEILEALNVYRKNHGRQTLSSDDKLCALAQWRADEQEKLGTLDTHKGLEDYLNDPKHWEELEEKAVGENTSYGYTLSGTHLIEWLFDADEEHRSNQLNPRWNRACAATSGVTVEVLFGEK